MHSGICALYMLTTVVVLLEGGVREFGSGVRASRQTSKFEGGGGGYVRWGGLNFREFSRRSPLGDQSVTFRKGIL